MHNNNLQIKSASAFLRQNKIFMQAYSETTVGLDILSGKVFTAEVSDLLQLGDFVKDIFQEAKKGIPHPTQEEWKNAEKNSAILKATGITTYNAMMKSSKSVDFSLENNQIKFVPMRFGGTSGDKKGYHNLKDKVIITADFESENLGKLLLEAFERCE